MKKAFEKEVHITYLEVLKIRMFVDSTERQVGLINDTLF